MGSAAGNPAGVRAEGGFVVQHTGGGRPAGPAAWPLGARLLGSRQDMARTEAPTDAAAVARAATDLEAAEELPIVARLAIEIRSDGTRTIARGAMHDALSGEQVAIEVGGGTVMQLARQLTVEVTGVVAGVLSRALGSSLPKALTKRLLRRRLPPNT